ncbi:MAG: spore germination protein [Anaerovoracaceae bacterium]
MQTEELKPQKAASHDMSANYWEEVLKNVLPIDECFDILVRHIKIGNKNAVIYFIDGLVNGEVAPIVMSHLLQIQPRQTENVDTADEFLTTVMPFLDTSTESSLETVIKQLFSGLAVLAVEGFREAIIIDIRDYPNRSIEEPSKEKSLRGAKDGFAETFMTNIALIRRRIRSPQLIFKSHVLGEITKTDVCIAYMKNKADLNLVQQISDKLDELKVQGITVGEQTVVEHLVNMDKKHKSFFGWLNPFPKVRYTQRPDVAAAHIAEGKVALIVDTSPTIVLLPTGIFDFLQDVDDYYFPALTGNYFRMIRVINFLGILLLTPIFLLFADGHIPVYEGIRFFIPDEDFAIPVFWQFILLEIAVDGLKLASLNTPDSLGTSLSIIGALILGEFSVSSGWFIPQTILCMAVVALASFTQPSIELGYGIKFMRILILVGIATGGIWGSTFALIGGAAALAVDFIAIATTKTIVGTSYLYPLIPFNGNAMKHLIFRTKE